MFCWFSCVGAWQDLRPYLKAYGPVVSGATVGGYAMYRMLKARDSRTHRAHAPVSMIPQQQLVDNSIGFAVMNTNSGQNVYIQLQAPAAPQQPIVSAAVNADSTVPVARPSSALRYASGSGSPVSLLYGTHAVEGYIDQHALSDAIGYCLKHADFVGQLVDFCILHPTQAFHVALLPWSTTDCMQWCRNRCEQEQVALLAERNAIREQALAEVRFPFAAYSDDPELSEASKQSFIQSIVELHKQWILKGVSGFDVAWFDRWQTTYTEPHDWFDTNFIPHIRDPIAVAISAYNQSRTTDDSCYNNLCYDRTVEAAWLLQKWHQHCLTKQNVLQMIGITEEQFDGMITKLKPLYTFQSIFCIKDDVTRRKTDVLENRSILSIIASVYGIDLKQNKFPSNFFYYETPKSDGSLVK